LLERAELDDRACFTFKRLVTGFAELSELPNFIVTAFIGFPYRVAKFANGITIIAVIPRCFIAPSPIVRVM
jgi:hypothetical protein